MGNLLAHVQVFELQNASATSNRSKEDSKQGERRTFDDASWAKEQTWQVLPSSSATSSANQAPMCRLTAHLCHGKVALVHESSEKVRIETGRPAVLPLHPQPSMVATCFWPLPHLVLQRQVCCHMMNIWT